MNHSEIVRNELKVFKENELIISNTFFKSIYDKYSVSEFAFYKVIERMIHANEIVKVSKGVYTKPKKSKYGIVPISEKSIIDHFTNHNRGMVIDYKMYNNEKLTTQVAKKTRLYSNNLTQETKTINRIEIVKVDIDFSYRNCQLFKLFEVLENYANIEDLDEKMFVKFTHETSKQYSDSSFEHIYSKKKYKKSTIAFLQKVLESNNIENNLEKYLSMTSKYKIPLLGVANEPA